MWGKNKELNEKSTDEILEEIRKVKQNRLQREQEKQKLEEERQNQVRLRELETYYQWKQKEESFHKFQSKIRALVRITQGKEEFVDKISKIYYIYKKKINYSPHLESYMRDIVQQIQIQDKTNLKKLNDLAKNYQQENEYEQENETYISDELKNFWECIENASYFYLEDKYLNFQEFHQEITQIFINKNLKEILILQQNISQTLANPSLDKNDQLYWQNVYERLLVYKASLVFAHLYNTFFEQNKELTTLQVQNIAKKSQDEVLPYEDLENQPEHTFSPILFPYGNDERDKLALQGEKIEELREIYLSKILKKAINALENKKVKNTQFVIDNQKVDNTIEKEEVDMVTQKLLEIEKKKPMEDGEEVFDDQFHFVKQYEWQDQYKSKKPKYFNRVKWGFDWNKYNQIHFDTDNIPPKYIQGYKFNIFYPELIEKEKTPEYSLEKAEDPTYCIIKFTSGPPYEDIAFKILNKEWDYSDKKGFKCYFSRGVLTLYFNFKRNKYRR